MVLISFSTTGLLMRGRGGGTLLALPRAAVRVTEGRWWRGRSCAVARTLLARKLLVLPIALLAVAVLAAAATAASPALLPPCHVPRTSSGVPVATGSSRSPDVVICTRRPFCVRTANVLRAGRCVRGKMSGIASGVRRVRRPTPKAAAHAVSASQAALRSQTPGAGPPGRVEGQEDGPTCNHKALGWCKCRRSWLCSSHTSVTPRCSSPRCAPCFQPYPTFKDLHTVAGQPAGASGVRRS